MEAAFHQFVLHHHALAFICLLIVIFGPLLGFGLWGASLEKTDPRAYILLTTFCLWFICCSRSLQNSHCYHTASLRSPCGLVNCGGNTFYRNHL